MSKTLWMVWIWIRYSSQSLKNTARPGAGICSHPFTAANHKPPKMKEFARLCMSATMVVYHLSTKSGNFGRIVNGKSNFVSPNGNFLGKTGFLESRPKFPNGISDWKLRVPFASFHWFQVVWFGSPLIHLSGKSRGNRTSASPWKFPFGIWRVPFTTSVDQPVFLSKW